MDVFVADRANFDSANKNLRLKHRVHKRRYLEHGTSV
jgi:hypothetical protein